jgi:hypothetical protein
MYWNIATGQGQLQAPFPSSATSPLTLIALTSNATYNFKVRSKVTLSSGAIAYSNWSTTGSFTCSNTAPTVISPTATSITTTGATLGATVSNNGGANLTARGTCWGTSNDPTTNCSTATLSQTIPGVFSHARTGMTPNTTYYYRGYATNPFGTGYSSSAQFTTSAPTVNLSANPTTITSSQSSTLTYSYSGATSCTATAPITASTYPNKSSTNVSTGALTSNRTYTLTCNSVSRSVTVTVQAQATNSLTVNKSGRGSVTSTSAPSQANQVNCGYSCQTQTVNYPTTAQVTLTATPAPGRIFTGWGIQGGGSCSRGSEPFRCTVNMSGPKTVTANFAIDPSYKEF